MFIDARFTELPCTIPAVICARVTEVPMACGADVRGLSALPFEAVQQAFAQREPRPRALTSEALDLAARETADEDCSASPW